MRHSKATLAVIAVLIATMSVPVLARGRSGGSHAGHSFSGSHAGAGRFHSPRFFGPRVGLFIGAPLYAPYFYPPPPLYYPLPPPVYMEQTPYLQQTPSIQQTPGMQQTPGQGANWYFCPGSNAYYPYVEQCPGGWQQVAPQPQG